MSTPTDAFPLHWPPGRKRNMRFDMQAISKTIEALRGIDRWGTGDMMEAAFTGFTALPAPAAEEEPHQVLGVSENATLQEIDYAYRRLAQQCHPDRGGSTDAMSRINTARAKMLGARP